MELIVDDRERVVIEYLKRMTVFKIERITVGDYAFVYNGKIILIVERKTLKDLAASIKDGRMNNNLKLLDAQEKSGCNILYIIEGPAYPNLDRKFARMPFKCLQGKLDSLLFRSNVKIIWTRDAEHTARRLFGLIGKLTKLTKEGVFGEFKEIKGGVESVIKHKHTISLDTVHIKMLTCLPLVSYKTAMAVLKVYPFKDIIIGQIDEKKLYNLTYIDSGFRLGPRGTKLYRVCKQLSKPDGIYLQKKILACISGITLEIAQIILESISFNDIVNLDFKKNSIASLQKNTNRKIGPSIEGKIYNTFFINDMNNFINTDQSNIVDNKVGNWEII